MAINVNNIKFYLCFVHICTGVQRRWRTSLISQYLYSFNVFGLHLISWNGGQREERIRKAIKSIPLVYVDKEKTEHSSQIVHWGWLRHSTILRWEHQKTIGWNWSIRNPVQQFPWYEFRCLVLCTHGGDVPLQKHFCSCSPCPLSLGSSLQGKAVTNSTDTKALSQWWEYISWVTLMKSVTCSKK